MEIIYECAMAATAAPLEQLVDRMIEDEREKKPCNQGNMILKNGSNDYTPYE